MEELESFIEKCQQFVHSQGGSAYSMEVFWADPLGKDRAVVSVCVGDRHVEVDWNIDKSYHIRSGNSRSLYRGALNESPEAVNVFAEMTALLNSMD